MRDIGKRTAVDECRRMLQRLYQIRLNSIDQKHSHCALRIQVACRNRCAFLIVGDDHTCETFLQVFQTGSKTQCSHNFGSDRNHEVVFTRYTGSFSAQTDDDVTQRAVVHIQNALPDNAAFIDV